MANRFLERLATGIPLVADGGMGVLVSSAAPARAHPGGGEPPRSRDCRQAPCRLHPGRRGRDRDEHVRSEPPQARRALPRGRAPRDQQHSGQARPRRPRDDRQGRLHRRLDRAARRARRDKVRTRRDLRRAGGGARGPGRGLLLRRDVLRAGGARSGDRGRAQRLLPADPGDADLRRRRRDAFRPDRQRSGRPARRARGRSRGRKPRRRHPGVARRAGRDGRQRSPARRDAEHRAREHGGEPHHLPARLARVLRGVRRARPHPRSSHHRRLLRDDADRDRLHRLGGQGGARAERAARLRGARGRRRCARAPGGNRARASLSRAGVGALGADRPTAWRKLRRDAGRRAHAQGLGEGRIRRHQRQRDRARCGERPHALDRDRADRRDRDDPSPHDPRCDDHGPRVAAPRLARLRHPQRAGGHRRSTGGGRLSRARAASTRSTRSASRSSWHDSTAARTTTGAQSTQRPRSTSASRSTPPQTTSTRSSSASSRRSMPAPTSR